MSDSNGSKAKIAERDKAIQASPSCIALVCLHLLHMGIASISAGGCEARVGRHRAATEIGRRHAGPSAPTWRPVAGVLQGLVRPFCTGCGHRERLQARDDLKKARVDYNKMASGSNMLARLRAESDSVCMPLFRPSC